ncbi:MAG: hypothetical protein DWQ01_18600 [Planctomycetota bacterium]|nr:MAG: hypothetical protein DWQ01_18600 [Planctomycetota bacterium]
MGRILLWTGLLALGSCVQAPADPGEPPGAPDPARARAMAAGLTGLAGFIGEWEGLSRGLEGDLRLAKRMTWLVRDSWLLEQNVVFEPQTGEEIGRSAILYHFEPDQGMIHGQVLGPVGSQGESWLKAVQGRNGYEVRLQPDEPPFSLFITTSFSRDRWEAEVYEPGPGDEWTRVERLELNRIQRRAAQP